MWRINGQKSSQKDKRELKFLYRQAIFLNPGCKRLLCTHISAIYFNKINWLPVEHRVELCTATTVFKFWNQLTPSYFEDIFTPFFNKYNTRSQMALDIPLWKTTVGRKSILFPGPKIWFETNISLKAVKTTANFTHALKKHMLKIW